MAGWKKRSDDEIRELADEILAGRVLGTWQLATWPERNKLFPDFLSNREWSLINRVYGGYYETPAAAQAWADMPMIAEGFVYRRPEESPEPPFHFHTLELLSIDDWKRLSPLIGSPKRDDVAQGNNTGERTLRPTSGGGAGRGRERGSPPAIGCASPLFPDSMPQVGRGVK